MVLAYIKEPTEELSFYSFDSNYRSVKSRTDKCRIRRMRTFLKPLVPVLVLLLINSSTGLKQLTDDAVIIEGA